MNASLKALLNEQYKLVAELREENKNLKERIDELEKCNLNLQERLDNKEKVNKSLREELEKLKSTYVYDAKQVRDVC